jgi:hypothetical protein
VQDIIAAGDIGSWRSRLDRTPGFGDRAWVWIDNMIDPASAEIGSLILAFGRKDKYQKAGELLARSVPDCRVFRNDGSHKWVTWRPLWAEILNSQSWYGLGNPDADADSIDDTPSPEKEAVRL